MVAGSSRFGQLDQKTSRGNCSFSPLTRCHDDGIVLVQPGILAFKRLNELCKPLPPPPFVIDLYLELQPFCKAAMRLVVNQPFLGSIKVLSVYEVVDNF